MKINAETGKVNKREDGKVLKPEGWTPAIRTIYKIIIRRKYGRISGY
jgi:hypothetical protein